MPTLVEIREEIAAKSKQLADIFEQAGPEYDMSKVTLIQGDSAAKAAEIKRRNIELGELGKKRDEQSDWDEMARKAREEAKLHTEPANGMVHAGTTSAGAAPQRKSLRELIDESVEYKAFVERGGRGEARIQVPYDAKTLITLTTVSPQAQRQELVNMALEERTIADLMLEGSTNSNTIEYYEETTVTNAAAETAEGSAKPEGALAWTLRTETVRDIPVWIPATRQALMDVPFLESQMRGRLMFMVRRREEAEILTGDGIAPNLRGILNRSGLQTQAKGADPTPTAVYKAMQLVRGSAGSGFAEPTAAVFHPNDWTDIRTLTTADGIYIWGSPADPGPDRIWGVPVRQTTALTQNTGLVGAFRPYAEIVRRDNLVVMVSTEHSTYFVENKVAILAEERVALAVYRPSAFATVTGI